MLHKYAAYCCLKIVFTRCIYGHVIQQITRILFSALWILRHLNLIGRTLFYSREIDKKCMAFIECSWSSLNITHRLFSSGKLIEFIIKLSNARYLAEGNVGLINENFMTRCISRKGRLVLRGRLTIK